jgi:hypothetical protein
VELTAGREQVRVARALRSLPLVAAEFAAGWLSYSKVRAVSRVATAETEATLVEWALHATAAQLDRLVAAQRRVARAAEVRARHDARYLSWRWDDDCSLIGSFPLPPEQAAILLQALEVAKDGLPAGAAAVVDTPEEAPATPVDAHHWLVNDGGWTVAVIRPGAWRFCASDGRHLDSHHASARASLPLPVDPSIAPDAVTGFWAGEPLDIRYATSILNQDVEPNEDHGRIWRL